MLAPHQEGLQSIYTAFLYKMLPRISPNIPSNATIASFRRISNDGCHSPLPLSNLPLGIFSKNLYRCVMTHSHTTHNICIVFPKSSRHGSFAIFNYTVVPYQFRDGYIFTVCFQTSHKFFVFLHSLSLSRVLDLLVSFFIAISGVLHRCSGPRPKIYVTDPRSLNPCLQRRSYHDGRLLNSR